MSLISHATQHHEAQQSEFHQLIDTIYSSVTDPNGFNPFLHRLQHTLNCETATLSIRDRSSQRVVGGWYQDMPNQVIEWYISNLGHRDPLLQRAVDQEDVGFCNAFSGNRGELSDPIVQDWCTEAGLVDGACAVIYKDAHSIYALTLGRSQEHGPFSHLELEQLNALIIDLRRAIGLKLAFGQNQKNQLMHSIFEQINMPLMYISQGGYVRYINKQAEHWQAQSKLMKINESGIAEFCNGANNARFLSHSSEILDKNSNSSEMVRVTHQDQGASLLLTSINEDESGQTHAEKGLLVTVYPWTKDHGINPERIQKFFGLSKTEAQVCDYLCQGMSLENIAETTFRGLSTIRSHIKSIYQKTSTNRQAELVSHVLTTLMRSEYL